MLNRDIRKLAFLTALGFIVGCSAKTQPNGEPNGDYEAGVRSLAESVNRALPEGVGGNPDLIDNLLNADLGPQLTRTFDDGAVWKTLVGRTQPRLDPACAHTETAAGGPDQEECVASLGTIDGRGVYKELRFSKNIGLGNIRFASRALPSKGEGDETTPSDLATKLTDTDAYEMALAFLTQTVGVSKSELAIPPRDFEPAPPLPVKSLAIGAMGETSSVVIQKVVFFPRGLTVPRPIRVGEYTINKVRAPGEAWVALGDATRADSSAIKGFAVSDWQDLRRNTKIVPTRDTKSRDQVVDEIARELASQGRTQAANLKILIGLSAEPQGSFGLLLPVVQVFASPMPRDPDEETQEAVANRTNKSTAGSVFEVSLVNSQESELR